MTPSDSPRGARGDGAPGDPRPVGGAGAPVPAGPPVSADELLGRWRLLRADPALDFAPGVSMEFQQGGRLTYAFDAGRNRHVLPMLYRLDGDELHTESLTTAHDTTARLTAGAGGSLVMDFAGARAWFVREL